VSEQQPARRRLRPGSGSLDRRALVYLVVSGAALSGALVAHDAPLAGLGLPFLLVLLASLVFDTTASEATVDAELVCDDEVVKLGEETTVKLRLSADRSVRRCRVELRRDLEGIDRPDSEETTSLAGAVFVECLPRWLCSLRPGTPTVLELTLCSLEPGEVGLGPIELELSGPIGLYRRSVRLPVRLRIAVRPREESLLSLPRSARVRVAAGDRLARRRGEGIELAEVRPQLRGERALRINWRVTARRQSPHVTLRHPEQSTDVVLFADTFDPLFVTRVIEASSAAAAAYLSRRDRVGLVCFGGVLDWVEAGAGPRQLERIRLRLAAARPYFSYAWKTIERIPPRAVPAGALVIAISPLRDERAVAAIAALRARGHDVAVLELEAAPSPVTQVLSPIGATARLLSEMEREDLRQGLWEMGIAVATLEPGVSLAEAMAGLAEVMRRARPLLRR
jgi:uncharacterized protein (DUF58 family)